MKSTLAAIVAAMAAMATLGNTLELVKKDFPAVQELAIQRRTDISAPHVRDRMRRRNMLEKRAGTVQVILENEVTLYFANVSIGTPQQNFQLHLDTGSSDLWVNSASSQLCTERNGAYCKASGTYIANSSSTYQYVNSIFNISYVDGSGAHGDYATDTFRLSSLTLENQQFGIGYVSTTPQGILGIGYQANEVQVNYAGLQEYNNVPATMYSSGVIGANAYSLWLNDLEANTGSILFGGVDSDKYHGDLETVPIVKTYGQYAEFIVALTGLGQNGNAGSVMNNSAIAVLLDSGSSLTYLPDDIVTNIYSAYGAQYNSDLGAATVTCSLMNEQGSLDFSFSDTGNTISIDLTELVLVGGVNNGQEYCILGIAPNGGSTSVLGDTFLRSAYVVYDLSGNTISFAKTDFNATSSNIQEITTGSAGIPGATAVASAVTGVSVVQTGAGRIQGGFSTTTVGSVAATGAPRLAAAAIAAVGVGAMFAL